VGWFGPICDGHHLGLEHLVKIDMIMIRIRAPILQVLSLSKAEVDKKDFVS